MRNILAVIFVCAAAGHPLAAAAQGSLPSYEPQQRLRTALDTCLTATEVMQGAYCVQKCAAGFRAVASGGKPRCVGLSPGAKHEPKKPSFKPLPENTPGPAPGSPP